MNSCEKKEFPNHWSFYRPKKDFHILETSLLSYVPKLMQSKHLCNVQSIHWAVTVIYCINVRVVLNYETWLDFILQNYSLSTTEQVLWLRPIFDLFFITLDFSLKDFLAIWNSFSARLSDQNFQWGELQ